MAKKSKPTIYVIDDDKMYAEAIERSLRGDGYEVELFVNPVDALNKFKIKPPDAAIVDCMLPKKNGIDFVSEIRMNGFDSLPVIMISGIFKDKSYAQKAIEKTGAITFLSKPFDNVELLHHLGGAIQKTSSNEDNPISDFISNSMVTKKKVLRFLGKLDHVIGYELPLIINTITDSEIGGSLNLSLPGGSIMGIEFSDGHIISISSEASNEICKKVLLRDQYIDAGDLSEDILRGDLLGNLVNESYISPHVVESIKCEQFIEELRGVLNEDNIQLSFSVSSRHKYSFSLDSSRLVTFLEGIIEKSISEFWLKAYYEQWMSWVVKYGPSYKSAQSILSSDLVLRCGSWLDNVDDGISLMELMARGEASDEDKFKCLYLLVIYRYISFESESNSLHKNNDQERMESLYEILSMKNPIEIFKYFGSSLVVGKSEVDKIYKELAKIYHPDKLSSNASDQHKKLADAIFRLIANAHGILTNEKKREVFEEQMKQKAAEKQLKAEAILEDGIKELRRNRVDDAIILLEIAAELHPSQHTKIYVSWAKLKQAEVSKYISEEFFSEIKGSLDLIPSEERTTPEYFHTLGLYFKAQGNPEQAKANFVKALQKDGGFIESRRELSTLGDGTQKTAAGSQSISSLLNQDLGTVVSNLFKKKSS